MGEILVHEFMSLDGNIDDPSWTFEFGWDPGMGDALAALTGRCQGILLGRRTFEMFEPAWSTWTIDDDPGGTVLQRHDEVRRLGHADRADLAQLHGRRGAR